MLNQKEITIYIPQRPPMVMIDNITVCDEIRTATSFKIKNENIFTKDGKLEEPGIIENIAQTCAARVGYICEKEQKPVPVGFIGAIKNLNIYSLPEINSEIHTEIKIELEIFDATVITASVKNNDNLIADCEMKIFLVK